MTSKRKRFFSFYAQSWNATRAATLAGYDDPAKAGDRILRSSCSEEMQEALKSQIMTGDEVMVRLTQQARLNTADSMVFTKDTDDDRLFYAGTDWEWVQNNGHLVKGMKKEKSGIINLEFYDAQKALELLGRANGLFVDKTDITSGGEKIVVTLKGADND